MAGRRVLPFAVGTRYVCPVGDATVGIEQAERVEKRVGDEGEEDGARMLMRFWQASLRILPIKSLTWPIAFCLASLGGECIERGSFVDFEPRRRLGAADRSADKSSLVGQVTRH
jgi:hypothetical protein